MQGTVFTLTCSVASWNWPGKLVFGTGRLETLGEEVRVLGGHAFVATTPELSALGLADRVQQLLEEAKGIYGHLS